MNDKEFGQRVRQLRETASLTREQFCDDELELSVRQLTRIEAGTSKPTFSKIQYIATRLGMGLYELMPDYVSLPERYSKLKFDVLRTPTYENEELMEKRADMMTEIYDDYYDDLPEEEKIAIDAIQSTIDVLETRTAEFGQDILNDYFEQIQRKKQFSANDLLIIRLFLMNLRMEVKQENDFQRFLELVEKFPGQIELVESGDLFILRDVMITSVGLLGQNEEYRYIPSLFDALDKLMQKTQDFQKKPILNLLKWKYELLINKDKVAATALYEEALLFARLIGNAHLIDKLEEDWRKDSQL
ncbi:helix-turn-helix domain-containing protein [Streptococcus suis]|uniref:Transcriptional regulator n=1 Tax=Streptococcus suis TaxID=1307 RepID=A0A0Z8EKI5_STRSU|nr:helix-turn-helix domain-containing protein [Streptococcus suis]NQH65596.1 transcriptional regulator [Streptococcus suis]NQH77811.1 transcriptional regulator [Streptococcus suis]NQJ48172.1 transcriptional regulator [Streptococcus suis]NQJ54420.1 transcriptional regulator [Streptococcus suis]NQM50865.1 transcriptional regulator [Streptococcus suis]